MRSHMCPSEVGVLIAWLEGGGAMGMGSRTGMRTSMRYPKCISIIAFYETGLERRQRQSWSPKSEDIELSQHMSYHTREGIVSGQCPRHSAILGSGGFGGHGHQV